MRASVVISEAVFRRLMLCRGEAPSIGAIERAGEFRGSPSTGGKTVATAMELADDSRSRN